MSASGDERSIVCTPRWPPQTPSPARRRPRSPSPIGRIGGSTPADGPDPYGNPTPTWLRIDWSDHLHDARARRRPGQLRRARPARGRAASAGAGLRPRALAAAGRTGSRTSRSWPAATARSRSTCPASARRRFPTGRSRSPPTRACCSSSATPLGVSDCARGRQLDGRLRRRRGGGLATRAIRAAGPGLRRRRSARACVASRPRSPRG